MAVFALVERRLKAVLRWTIPRLAVFLMEKTVEITADVGETVICWPLDLTPKTNREDGQRREGVHSGNTESAANNHFELSRLRRLQKWLQYLRTEAASTHTESPPEMANRRRVVAKKRMDEFTLLKRLYRYTLYALSDALDYFGVAVRILERAKGTLYVSGNQLIDCSPMKDRSNDSPGKRKDFEQSDDDDFEDLNTLEQLDKTYDSKDDEDYKPPSDGVSTDSDEYQEEEVESEESGHGSSEEVPPLERQQRRASVAKPPAGVGTKRSTSHNSGDTFTQRIIDRVVKIIKPQDQNSSEGKPDSRPGSPGSKPGSPDAQSRASVGSTEDVAATDTKQNSIVPPEKSSGKTFAKRLSATSAEITIHSPEERFDKSGDHSALKSSTESLSRPEGSKAGRHLDEIATDPLAKTNKGSVIHTSKSHAEKRSSKDPGHKLQEPSGSFFKSYTGPPTGLPDRRGTDSFKTTYTDEIGVNKSGKHDGKHVADAPRLDSTKKSLQAPERNP